MTWGLVRCGFAEEVTADRCGTSDVRMSGILKPLCQSAFLRWRAARLPCGRALQALLTDREKKSLARFRPTSLTRQC